MHVVAGYQLKDIFKILRTRSDLNYLAKDHEGRLPSQLAMNADDDVGLGTFLLKKEQEQARREGKDHENLSLYSLAVPPSDG